MKITTSTAARASVPSGKGTRVERTITLARPVTEVYSFWRKLSNLPRFLRHLESVTETDNTHSRWVVKGPRDKRVHWDAEIIEEKANKMISWRSLGDSEVDNAGSVWFTPTGNGEGTLLKVALKYNPPAGKLGVAIAKLFGRDAEAELDDDLKELKRILEASPETSSGPPGFAV